MTKELGRVGVLYGGLSAEREVSLMSGQGVCEALQSLGVDAHLFDLGHQDLCDLMHARFDRVFIALHGRYGEDGTVQGALELLNLPYTGSGPMASSVAMDKVMTKQIWQHHRLPTPAWSVLHSEADLQTAAQRLDFPLILKPAHEGSTLGLTKVDAADALADAYALAAKYDPVALAEHCIVGREFTVPVLGRGNNAKALPVIEIRAPDGNYDYEHKYFSDATEYLCPAPISEQLTTKIQQLAEQAYNVIACEGWGRVDFMLDEAGNPWLLEVNTSPGMTRQSLVPMSAAAAGMSYAELCLAILRDARCKVQQVIQEA